VLQENTESVLEDGVSKMLSFKTKSRTTPYNHSHDDKAKKAEIVGLDERSMIRENSETGTGPRKPRGRLATKWYDH